MQRRIPQLLEREFGLPAELLLERQVLLQHGLLFLVLVCVAHDGEVLKSAWRGVCRACGACVGDVRIP